MKPILFNAEMVRAILDGRKTVTRRVIKPQPKGRPVRMTKDSCWPGYFAIQGTEKVIRLPYYPGNILWVRETWAYPSEKEILAGAEQNKYLYKADTPAQPCALDRWHPSIHMPREAARIFLRVTDLRAERLQEITEDGAKAEGAVKSYPYTDPGTGETAFMLDEKGTFRCVFPKIWDSTIKPTDLLAYGWDANPWVWVIKFERIRKEEAQKK